MLSPEINETISLFYRNPNNGLQDQRPNPADGLL